MKISWNEIKTTYNVLVETVAAGGNISTILDNLGNSDLESATRKVALYSIVAGGLHLTASIKNDRRLLIASAAINTQLAVKSAELVGMQIAEGKYFDAFSSGWTYIGGLANAAAATIQISKSPIASLVSKPISAVGSIATGYTIGTTVVAPIAREYLSTEEGQKKLHEFTDGVNAGSPVSVVLKALFSHQYYDNYMKIGEAYDAARDFTSRYIIEGTVNSYNQAVDGLSDGMVRAEQAYKYAESSFESAYNGLKDTAGQLVKEAQTLVQNLHDQTKETANEKITDLQNKIGEFQKTVGEVHQSMVENASRKIEEGVDFAQEMERKISDAAEALSEQVKKTTEDIGEWGKDAVESSLNAVRDFANKASEKAKEFSDAARDAAKQAGEAAEDFADAARKFFDGLPDFSKAWEEFKKSYPNLFPDSQGWYDNGHQCLAPWAKELNRDGKYYFYDPLALDLDGDGIETVATNGFTGTLFDHMGSGIRTATGWISADDGLLVRDINGNGIIDNGTELFGDNTKLKNGGSAQHGFAALADLDSNGDKVIDAKDAAFKELRVWRDINQDGISQNNELFTLQSLGIKSFNTAYTDTRQDLGSGNTLAQKGSYTKTDGTNAVMGDLELAADKIYSNFSDKVELTAAQAEAPNLKGTGRLRDLREAAALSNGLSATLKAYTAANTREAQLKLLDSLVLNWAKTDLRWNTEAISFKTFAVGIRTKNEGVGLTPHQVARLPKMLPLPEKIQAAINAARERIAILDAYSGENTRQIFILNEADAQRILKLTNETYQKLSESLYTSLLFQTRLKPYINQISFKLENNQFKIDYNGLTAAFNQVQKQNPQKAFVDLGEMLAYGRLNDWYTGRQLMERFIETARNNGLLEQYKQLLGNNTIALLTRTNGGDGDDVLQNVNLGENRNISLHGGNGNDTLIGGAGNDYLSGGNGSDTYVFGKGFGQDSISNYDSSVGRTDTIRFTDGLKQEDFSFTRSSNDLVIAAKKGTDKVTVSNYFDQDGAGNHRIDRIAFSNGKVLDVAAVKKLVTLGTSGDDRLRAYHSGSSLDGGLGNDYLYGGNGNDTLIGGEGNDNLSGGAGNDALNGGAGNDNLSGGAGNDALNGGAGNDYLYGEDGNDTLAGGAGNDYLSGGNGSDTYVFGKGFGQDSISNYDSSVGRTDTIRFEHLRADNVLFERSGSDLLLKERNGNNSVRVMSYFSNRNYEIDRFEFADRTISTPNFTAQLTAANNMIQAMSVFGSGSASALSGVGTETTDNRPLLAASTI